MDQEKSPCGEDVPQAKEGVGGQFFAEFACWLSQVDRDEDGESHKQVFVEHLVFSHNLIVVVEDGDCCELSQGEEDHHAKTVKVGTQPCPANPEAVHNGLQTLRLRKEVGKESTFFPL